MRLAVVSVTAAKYFLEENLMHFFFPVPPLLLSRWQCCTTNCFYFRPRVLIFLLIKKKKSEVDYKSKERTSLTQTNRRAGYSYRLQDELDLENQGSFNTKQKYPAKFSTFCYGFSKTPSHPQKMTITLKSFKGLIWGHFSSFYSECPPPVLAHMKGTTEIYVWTRSQHLKQNQVVSKYKGTWCPERTQIFNLLKE